MILEELYLHAFNELKSSLESYSLTAMEAISLIDLTLLDETASDEALSALNEKGNRYQVAAVCVLPQHTRAITLSHELKLATVINFPEGNQSDQQVLSAIDAALTDNKIDEIDYVFPYYDYLDGEQSFALAQCQQVLERCQQQKLSLKVILETGALPSLEIIYQLSRELIDYGCHFLKTSTGKVAQGATPAAAFVMLKAIKDSQTNCGLKVSGGIRKPEQAFGYMALAQQILGRTVDKSWFRIGASSLLDELV
ncbi:Deoxyribose-phosphate aldolase [Legionella massiliensis]|uniref:Deoxyribose-phosphate aldolase n=1 Tax=Legionella massiliensis TaxID=1034943 RepID=A0A078KXN7_9GAMM|nr:deoxyribose-phosphate aldolase [Legionella massiliensis]CDZ79180.1 Deoxyribose-phosphate aldolase [Legionella massiliensis]CEE14918.1 Deoxyribose-phosphate aldolase [Legionella massiliensis]